MSQESEFLETAEEKLKVAEMLFENEAYSDSISRAYYGMYNAARGLLFLKDSKPKTHAGVSYELGKLYRDELSAELTREFSRIQNLRLEADYEPSKKFSKEETEGVIELVEEFVKKARTIIDESAK